MIAFITGAMVAQAQLPVEPELPGNETPSNVQMDWSAGFSSVLPGDVARRADAEQYRSELLEAMAELARCFDAQDAAATAQARIKVRLIMNEVPEQVNDVAVSADGKWLFTPLTIATYMEDDELEKLALKAGALPFLPAHTVKRYYDAVVKRSPHSHARRFPSAVANMDVSICYPDLHELYLLARAHGVEVRVDPSPAPRPREAASAPRHASELAMPESINAVNHYRYYYTAGDVAARRDDEVYESDLLKAYRLLTYLRLNPNTARPPEQSGEELHARVLRGVLESDTEMEDTYCRSSEHDSGAQTLLYMALCEKDDELVELLLSRHALPFFPATRSIPYLDRAQDVERIMRARACYLSPLEVALQARAKGMRLKIYENRWEYFNSQPYISGSRDNLYATLPKGRHLPGASEKPSEKSSEKPSE